jgi:outer membrane protein TolC
MRSPIPAPAFRRSSILLCLLTLSAVAGAQTAEPLPEPLTLQFAMDLADEPHPTLELARSGLTLAEARRQLADSDDDFEAGIRLDARYVDDSNLVVQKQNNDSSAVLLVRKRLYDFGRTEHAIEAADAELKGQELLLRDAVQERRLDIMRAFFNVILVDLEYARANEAMATAFVAWDRAVDRNELGTVSDIEMLRLEDVYQEARISLRRADTQVRAARLALAQELNRPEQIPATLVPPDLPANDSPLPAYNRLVQHAFATSPRLLALREQLEAARLRVAERRKGAYPTLSAEANAGYWERDLGNNREPYGASLILDIPLFKGGRVDAEVAESQAQALRLQAELGAQEYALRQAILEAWQEIQVLTAQREQARVRTDYRDLYLDRSRAEYELELKTDLGDAMVQQTAARLFAARAEFELALAWARLAALVGEPAFDPTAPPADNPLTRLVNETPP